MTDLQNEVIPLQQLLGPEAVILEERLYDVNVHTAADILQQWLVQKVKDATFSEPKTLHLIRSMYAKSGDMDIARLPELTGLSMRQIERKWREITGMSPKKMSVVLRFDAARCWLFHHPDADLMDVTHRFGYYDYAHFSRAFKNGIGMTPRQFQQWIMNMNIPGNNGEVVFVQDERDHMC
jgi:transcriptional regulator GlxA family with amidase domain